MTLDTWTTRLSRSLLVNGLPREYVCRTTREMADHLEDMRDSEGDDDASRRLGDPDTLAQMLTHGFRRQSLFGRHPFLTFWLSPIPIATFLAHIVYLFTIELIMPVVVRLYGESEVAFVSGSLDATKVVLVLAMHLWLQAIPVLLTMRLYRIIASRAARPWTSIIPAMILFLLYFSMTKFELTWPSGTNPGNYRIDIGTVSGFSSQPVTQGLQALFVALVCILWLYRVAGEQSSERESAVTAIP
ncbi:MAG: hypothetical protein JNM43_18595 [Planctomycetaceae bacterium]|nr:hypothetical protein [Planctomycetaceae bacterium]